MLQHKKTDESILEPPSPTLAISFNDPRLLFTPLDRMVAQLVLYGIFFFFAAVAALLVFFGFPRQIFSPEYAFSLEQPLRALTELAAPELSLGLLIIFFLFHQLLERGRGESSLAGFRRGKAEMPKNISKFFHPDTFRIVGQIASDMRGKDTDALIPTVLSRAFACRRLSRALQYLEIDALAFAKDVHLLQNLLDRTFDADKLFTLNNELFQRLLREALLEAMHLGHEYVLPEDLALAVLDEEIPALKTFIARWNITQDDLRSTSFVLENSRRHFFFRRGSRTLKHRIMNRAWTARPTPLLDRFAHDLTDLAREGYVGFMVGHQGEANTVLRILNRASKNNVLLVGEAGSGKTTILEHVAWLITREEVPPKLFDKRLTVLDVGLLVAGAKNVGELQQRVVGIVDDILRAGNVILAIPEIHTLLAAGQSEGVSISTVLGPVFSQGAFQVIGLTDARSYHTLIEPHADFKNHFDTVEVEAIGAKDALQVLFARARALEEFEGIAISFPALKKTIELAERYVHDKLFPARALDLLGEGVELAKRNRAPMLTDEMMAALVSERTGIPVSDVTQEESAELLNLNAEIHKRIVDQEEAVNAIADVVRESRAGVRRANAPVGSFLFVGPTGVGKTECAKALAEVYFKSAQAMIRLDMSEYQTRESVYRLIGSPESSEPGQLTERMKHDPYSLLLLDEFEKAHANILDIFLQVFDDGRVTDASGTTVDFTNAVIIATSNAHSVFIMESLKAGKNPASIAQELKDKLTAYFKPELLNRFDDIIVFKPLSQQDITRIASIQLKTLFAQLEKDRGVMLRISDSALQQLAALGYNPEYGARPLRHVLRKKVRDLVAEEILKNNLVRGDSAIIDVRDDTFALVKTV